MLLPQLGGDTDMSVVHSMLSKMRPYIGVGLY